VVRHQLVHQFVTKTERSGNESAEQKPRKTRQIERFDAPLSEFTRWLPDAANPDLFFFNVKGAGEGADALRWMF
jgi:hypothetical protein